MTAKKQLQELKKCLSEEKSELRQKLRKLCQELRKEEEKIKAILYGIVQMDEEKVEELFADKWKEIYERVTNEYPQIDLLLKLLDELYPNGNWDKYRERLLSFWAADALILEKIAHAQLKH